MRLPLHDDGIPIVDLRAGAAAPAQLWAACSGWGCFHLIGGARLGRLGERLVDACRALHALAPADKERLVAQRGRGYLRFDGSRGASPNAFESIQLMRVAPDGAAPALPNVYQGKNQWPPPLAGWRRRADRHFVSLERLARDLLARLLDGRAPATRRALDRAFREPTLSLRYLRYPRRRGAPSAFVRHIDYGGLTLLAHDDPAGLSLTMPSGRVLQVTRLDGSLFGTVGEALARWTNGQLHAPPHEVRSTAAARHATVFFFDPAFGAEIRPLPELCAGARPRFPPVRYGVSLLLRTFVLPYGAKS